MRDFGLFGDLLTRGELFFASSSQDMIAQAYLVQIHSLMLRNELNGRQTVTMVRDYGYVARSMLLPATFLFLALWREGISSRGW